MKTRSCLVVLTLSLILISSLGLGSTPKAEAAVVGHFTDVEGRVDIMKGGHFPANQVKVQDPVEVGDVIRTKSLSRAQVKFVDDTVLTISPESRVGVEEYMYDGSKGQRKASLEVFRGLVHTLVTKIIKVEQPDFLIKTHTGILGIRGSDVYTHPHPTSTHYYMNSGEATVKNRWSEIKGEVNLGPRQFTVVGQGLTPTTPMHFDLEDIAHLKSRLAPQSGKGGTGGTSGTSGTSSGTGSSTTGGGGPAGPTDAGGSSPSGSDPATSGTGLTTSTAISVENLSPTSTTPASFGSVDPGGQTSSSSSGSSLGSGGITPGTITGTTTGSGIYIPPASTTTTFITAPAPTTPQPSTFTFTQQYYGSFNVVSAQNSATYWGSGWGQRTGVYDGYFATNSSTLGVGSVAPYNGISSGTVTGIMNGTVTGFSGQDLTGTMTYNGTNSYGSNINFTAPVTIKPDGALTFQYQGAQFNQVPGTYFEQTASGNFASQAFAPRNSEFVANRDQLAGTSSTAGAFNASFALTNNSSIINKFRKEDYGTTSITQKGVVADGALGGWGALTAILTTGHREMTRTLAGSLYTAGPGIMYATLLGSEILANGRQVTTRGIWVQVPQASDYVTFTQNYYGSFTQKSREDPNKASVKGSAWGFTNVVGQALPYAATLTGANSASGGGTGFPAKDYRTMDLIMAGYLIQTPNAQGKMTGSVYGIGEMAPYTATETPLQGAITLRPNGKATINFTSTWVSPSAAFETINGRIKQTPGVFFEASAAGKAQFAANRSGQVQTISIEPISGNLRIPAVGDFRLAFDGGLKVKNTASQPNTFSAKQPEHLTVDVQGVIVPPRGAMGGRQGGPAPRGNLPMGDVTLRGAMSMTAHNAAKEISSFRGPVSIGIPSGQVTATIIGKNLVGPDRNIPATQRGKLKLTPRGRGGGGV